MQRKRRAHELRKEFNKIKGAAAEFRIKQQDAKREINAVKARLIMNAHGRQPIKTLDKLIAGNRSVKFEKIIKRNRKAESAGKKRDLPERLFQHGWNEEDQKSGDKRNERQG